MRRQRQTSAYSRAVAAEIRAEAGRQSLRQADIADRAAIPRSSFGPYWNGDRPLDVEQLSRVADVLGIGVVELVAAARRSVDRLTGSDRPAIAEDADIQVAAYESPEPKGLPEPEQP